MKHIEFHGILARITGGNPVIMTVMNSVLEVLSHFVNKIGFYDNTFVVPSRRRFMKHLVEGDANCRRRRNGNELKRLQRTYLSLIDMPPADQSPRKRSGSGRLKAVDGKRKPLRRTPYRARRRQRLDPFRRIPQAATAHRMYAGLASALRPDRRRRAAQDKRRPDIGDPPATG